MPETEEQIRARQLREADQSARTMFNLFPQGTIDSARAAVQRNMANAPSPTMMAGSAGVNPLTASNIPTFPMPRGPLVRTDYGLPPSERPDYRNPAMQWDARQPQAQRTANAPIQVPLPTAISPTSVGQNLVTQQSLRNPVLPLTLTQNRVIPETSPSVREIQTPYGSVFASNAPQQQGMPTQAQSFASRATAYEGRTPEQQQALLAQVRQSGRNIAQGYRSTMNEFARSTIPQTLRDREMPAPQGRIGQPLIANFPRSREAMTQARQMVSPAMTMAAFSPTQVPSPFIEDRLRNPFSSIYGFSG